MFGRKASLALALVVACTQTDRAQVPVEKPLAAARPSAIATSSQRADPADAAGGAEWVTLVHDERWDAAWRELEALPDPEKSHPEIRYARARVALAREDAARALPLLAGLERPPAARP